MINAVVNWDNYLSKCVDLDKSAPEEQTDQDLHCLPNAAFKFKATSFNNGGF